MLLLRLLSTSPPPGMSTANANANGPTASDPPLSVYANAEPRTTKFTSSQADFAAAGNRGMDTSDGKGEKKHFRAPPRQRQQTMDSDAPPNSDPLNFPSSPAVAAPLRNHMICGDDETLAVGYSRQLKKESFLLP